MAILALRILPAFAIARLGSDDTPLAAYSLKEMSGNPLGYRRITPEKTFDVDADGEIRGDTIPPEITFKKDGHIRPVAPFLTVYAITDESEWPVPLDTALLKENGSRPSDVRWTVWVANRKVFRRTGDKHDIVSTPRIEFSDHNRHPLDGRCDNFLDNGHISFGHVQYIKPNSGYPEIRLRFTPGAGKIYGPNKDDKMNPIQVYDTEKGKWFGFAANANDPRFNDTLPPALFANQALIPVWLNNNIAVSRGYFDDACDGFVEVALSVAGQVLTATARICAAPPLVAPDVQIVRTLMDDLEQALCGTRVSDDETIAVTRARAEHIVRRAAETVRYLNVRVMNGNSVNGLPPLALDTMPAEEAFATGRMVRPIMSEATVDTLTVWALHGQVLAALRGGAAPWFLRLLRQPEEVADFTDRGRRKMPAMMSGSDGNYLALTYRQLHTLGTVARKQPDPNTPTDMATLDSQASSSDLTPLNRSAQLQHVGPGNPISSHPMTAVGNSCPGLEVDFRAVWRRMLVGIELREYDNLVMEVTDSDPKKQALKGQRLLRIDGVDVVTLKDPRLSKIEPVEVVTQMLAPDPANAKGNLVVATTDNPAGVASLEWSNTFAKALWDKMGRNRMGTHVWCDFTDAALTEQQPFAPKQLYGDPDSPPAVRLRFAVRQFFDPDTVVISPDLADAGELTQGLCSPWQNDYRECSCYYWAASRPDFVNVEPGRNGGSVGDNWLQKTLETGDYVPDDYADSRLVLYEDLFTAWEKWLRFHIGGKTAETKKQPADCIV
jgi:hypothetical protein